MKYVPLILILGSNICSAVSMQGFGARYYDDITETYSDVHETSKDLIPVIVVSSKEYKFEVSTVESIAKSAGVKVNNDSQTAWICLKSKDVNYWFISDNEMGNGDLTAITIAKDGSPCTAFKGVLSIKVNAPLLTTKNDLTSYFVKPRKDIVMYHNDIKRSEEYTQSNSIQYYLKDDRIYGVFISQGTTN